ncbi:A disintegrin and metalloproteinase with thrombospondin motifs 1 [Plakobranchus ocellatus]|uniref:A disintegrin and metalloproteinase with thrombospondin motifs 1 n=1 Tax=Plakobranchus ocellatus TaxID=259542 RepID=A0AAV4D650_9GAST|nr:A disintegrin and metalloproteinase with thrombospondin motifs 1 [Plakobranchus ocellatus]
MLSWLRGNNSLHRNNHTLLKHRNDCPTVLACGVQKLGWSPSDVRTTVTMSTRKVLAEKIVLKEEITRETITRDKETEREGGGNICVLIQSKRCLWGKKMPFGSAVLVTGVFIASLAIQNHHVSTAEGDDLVEYVIDTLVVVDDVMYNRWRSRLYPSITDPEGIATEIKRYAALVVHQANKRLKTLRNHTSFAVRLQIVDTQIDKDILQYVPASLLTRRINADVALETFQRWIVEEGLAANYDHAMLLTGKLMESAYEGSAQGSVAGRAYVGTLCDQTGQSVSVVQDLGGFQSVHFVAHEVAHSLGALHDGEPGAGACTGEDQYLMAPVSLQKSEGDLTNDRSDHPWYLSSCSAESIKTVIMNVLASDNNCLITSSTPTSEFTSTEDLVPGQMYNATAQCQMLYGSNSRPCLGRSFSSVSDICTAMYCSRTSSTCAEHFAAEGTSCGNKKWCQMGQCVESDQAPEMDDCPFGDTALLVQNRLSCEEYITDSPAACYNDDIREECCRSCAQIHSGSEVCPYGDKRRGCTTEVCDQVYPNGTLLADLCCETCSYNVTTTCEDVARVDGFTCRERVKTYGKQECYNGTVAFYCCETCSNQRLDLEGCEYGDLITGGYCQGEAKSDYSGCDRRLNSFCCLTCNPDYQRPDDGDPDSGRPTAPSSLLAYIHIVWLILTCIGYR